MPNDRNEAALAALLTEEGRRLSHPMPAATIELLAVALAARGALVPSALTDDQAANLVRAWGDTQDELLGPAVREMLVRLATDEA